MKTRASRGLENVHSHQQSADSAGNVSIAASGRDLGTPTLVAINATTLVRISCDSSLELRPGDGAH
jgi:hypothetical protein